MSKVVTVGWWESWESWVASKLAVDLPVRLNSGFISSQDSTHYVNEYKRLVRILPLLISMLQIFLRIDANFYIISVYLHSTPRQLHVTSYRVRVEWSFLLHWVSEESTTLICCLIGGHSYSLIRCHSFSIMISLVDFLRRSDELNLPPKYTSLSVKWTYRDGGYNGTLLLPRLCINMNRHWKQAIETGSYIRSYPIANCCRCLTWMKETSCKNALSRRLLTAVVALGLVDEETQIYSKVGDSFVRDSQLLINNRNVVTFFKRSNEIRFNL